MREEIITIPVLLVVAAVRIIAQSVAGMDGLGTLIGNLGVVAVLVWHLWYITTQAQPKMLKDFADQLEKIRLAREEERKATDRDHDKEREASARETAELRAMLIQILQGMRTAVHDVKDTAQSAINKVTLEKLQQTQRDQATN